MSRLCFLGWQSGPVSSPQASPGLGPSLGGVPALCQPPGHGPPLTGERVSNLEVLPLNEHRERITVRTDKGTEVAANLVIACSGIKVNSVAYRSAFGKWEAGP